LRITFPVESLQQTSEKVRASWNYVTLAAVVGQQEIMFFPANARYEALVINEVNHRCQLLVTLEGTKVYTQILGDNGRSHRPNKYTLNRKTMKLLVTTSPNQILRADSNDV